MKVDDFEPVFLDVAMIHDRYVMKDENLTPAAKEDLLRNTLLLKMLLSAAR